MRILHMIPDIGISNGVMSVILNYAKVMPDDIKFDVIYFADKPETRKSDIEALGGRVFKIDPPSPKDLLTGKMNGFFAQHKDEWQALHIHCPHFAVFIAPYAKKAGIKKIAVHCHTTEYSLAGNGRRNQLLALYAKYFVKDKFACSNNAGQLWFGSKKFTVLNNAIDAEAYAFNQTARDTVRKQMNLENAFVVSHIGRTDIAQKNHPFLLEIFAEIKKKKSNAKLLLIGANSNNKLDGICKKLGISEDVIFLGVRNDVANILQGCDAFVFPSISEGLPVSVIEAQAAGLPVVMSDAITKEVVVTKEAVQLSLDQPAELWAEKIIELSKLDRKNNLEIMNSSGWNISNTASQLVKYYRG